jgi:hypothetical protein
VISRTARFYLILLAVSITGAAACALFADRQFAAGFLFGALLAVMNQWILRRMVSGMAPGGASRTLAGVTAVVVGSRYLLLGAVGYVIVKYSGVSVISLLTGCFVALAALILDFLYELRYGSRT